MTFFLCKKVMRREGGVFFFAQWIGSFLGGGGLVIEDTAVFYSDIPLH